MANKQYEDNKYGRAKRRVDEIKGFYIHLMVYAVINAFILVNIALQSNEFWQWPHFFTLFFWGFGLLVHATITFRFNPLFGKNWEEKQIQKYIDKDKEEANKYF